MDELTNQVINRVMEVYDLIHAHTKTLYSDEQAIQSATATIYINVEKSIPIVKPLAEKLKNRIASNDVDTIVSAYKWHFKYLKDCDYPPQYVEHHLNTVIEKGVNELALRGEELEAYVLDYMDKILGKIHSDDYKTYYERKENGGIKE